MEGWKFDLIGELAQTVNGQELAWQPKYDDQPDDQY